ncbi:MULTISPECIES: hypothetical protein [Micromonospora]|uniref:hypothetical protein n=1 Tax=Micromonospora TaxID=1873 RepID=UPI001EF8E30E|nr:MULTISPECIES: hypothetical protein [Micromonospora]
MGKRLLSRGDSAGRGLDRAVLSVLAYLLLRRIRGHRGVTWQRCPPDTDGWSDATRPIQTRQTGYRLSDEIQDLVLRLTAEIRDWGHRRIQDEPQRLRHQTGDRRDLADTRSRCPGLDTVADLARGFAALVRHQRTGQHLDAWINRARNAGYPEIPGFAAGLTSDRDAVVAGLTKPWSSGPVEGQVTASRRSSGTCMAGRTSTSSAKSPRYTISGRQDRSRNACQSLNP